MNHFFRKIPLTVKLILVGLVPLLFLLYLAVETAREKKTKLEIIDNFYEGINTNILLTDITIELHLERRRSLGFMIQKEDATQMLIQRTNLDKALQELDNVLGEQAKDYKSFTLLSELKKKREQISNREISSSHMMRYYTSAITRINAISGLSVSQLPFLAPINKNLTSKNLLTQLNNNLGFLRAEVYSGLVNRNIQEHQYESIENTAAVIRSILAELMVKADSAASQRILAAGKTPEGEYFTKVLNDLLEDKKIDNAVNSETWWAHSSTVIDELNDIQKDLLHQVKTDIQELHERETLRQNLAIIAIIIFVLIVIAIIVYTIKSITDSLRFIRHAAENISTGATGVELKVYTNDAIGSLARSINLIDANNITLSKAADEIGKGIFSTPVQPRSEQDILGNAIVRMKNNLQQFTKENEERTWIQTGVSKINDSILGEKSLYEITSDSLATLIKYTGLEMGLFYISRNYEVLDYSSGYAVNNDDLIEKTIPFGQTLVGQAAVEKEMVYLDNIPGNYPKISSSIGSTPPTSILITPLVHNGLVEGTIELASLHEIPDATRQLLTEVSGNIATALQAAKSRAKLQHLFEETQSQSEELQAQHTEMENLNTELEMQTQKLQASEEELKVQQEELLQSNKELEQKAALLEDKNQVILERNLEIQKKAEELALSTKYKSEFLANMSHELRTPLNSILLLSRLMSEDDRLDAEQAEYANVIQSSGKGLLALIDEILDLSKIESGKMDLDYAPVETESITDDMRGLFEPLAREKNLIFKIDIHPGVPQVLVTDKMRLEQILKNLISNSLKFTHRGSVTMDIKPAENDGFIDFIVADTGIGIPPEKQKIVFEAFQQADGSTRRKFGGTGLGLSISRELAKLLGGEITVTSESDKGSIFTATIPVERPATQIQTTEETLSELTELKNELISDIQEKTDYVVDEIPAEIEDDRKNLKKNDKVVLIVEDDTNFATALLSFTHSKGYKGVVAVRGDLGVEMALKYKPLAVLLDIQLPVKDGWQVMEELKSNPDTRHIPVHIMSSMQVKQESLLKGAVDFIDKPVAVEQMQKMFAKLEDTLHRHPKKVLIVEENPKHAQALSYFLSGFNVTTEIKGTVKDGVDALSSKDVDCVILDMGIPDQTSYETLETVKQTPGLENLPIIVFTGKNISKQEENKIKQYADSIVVKTAHSYKRILDEVALFLHIVEENQIQDTAIKEKPKPLNTVLKDQSVLIADDDVRNIFSLTKALEQHQMKVLSAIDGNEALAQLEENPNISIVLMDMMMPGLDGYDTIARIRKNPKYKNLPILAVTAKAMMGDREKCIKAGASDYISKPVDIDQLISLLRVWLYDKKA